MRSAGLGILAVVAVGTAAYFYSRSSAAAESATGDAPLETVTGASGTTYGVQMIAAVETPNGRQLNFQISDAAGPMLEYAQFQGNNDSRMLVSLAPNRNLTDSIVINALNDFGIFVG